MLTCPDCGESGVLDWWRDRVAVDAWRPMLLREVTEWLQVVHQMAVTYEQVRQWVVRADLSGYMEDHRGRVLYDPDTVLVLGLRRAA